MLKLQNSENEYTTNKGQKWTTEEDNALLYELDKNVNIDIIALTHKRTIGGIIGRQQTIAYNMYLKNVSIDEIIIKTKLSKEQITEVITKKENIPKPVKISFENEIIQMKIEIKELKTTIKELAKMISTLYESQGM